MVRQAEPDIVAQIVGQLVPVGRPTEAAEDEAAQDGVVLPRELLPSGGVAGQAGINESSLPENLLTGRHACSTFERTFVQGGKAAGMPGAIPGIRRMESRFGPRRGGHVRLVHDLRRAPGPALRSIR